MHTDMLHQLRAIEKKMGLVLTLFKASVWAIVMQQTDAEDDDDAFAQEGDFAGGAYAGDGAFETLMEEEEEEEEA